MVRNSGRGADFQAKRSVQRWAPDAVWLEASAAFGNTSRTWRRKQVVARYQPEPQRGNFALRRVAMLCIQNLWTATKTKPANAVMHLRAMPSHRSEGCDGEDGYAAAALSSSTSFRRFDFNVFPAGLRGNACPLTTIRLGTL
ncbi:hypothetical protein SDC9_132766 [bioreactor metagenome]|uniref:Uncharacterized protein n=1 Tax=bioreactor metagenome TaxID=1076179 RepID=A0A645D908_9ZZZZ